MSRTAQQVIADEIKRLKQAAYEVDADILSTDAASKIIAALDQQGFRIIRHRVVREEGRKGSET